MAESPEPEGALIETELSRDLGMPAALSIGVGTMIAAGIFTLSGLAVSQVGSTAIVSFLVAALVALFTALPYCEFASIYPESGGGYLYARSTFAPPLAYLVGWCLLLAYTASCGFYIASLSIYFVEFIWHSPMQSLPGLLALAALTLLNVRGTKESAGFQIAVTLGKVVLLLWFIYGGMESVDLQALSERMTNDLVKIGGTAAMVFITFFGFSAIAASAGDIKNPTKTIPRAIFLSMAIVTVLYVLVVLVIVAANLTEYDESAMGVAAKQFLGPVGGLVIVGGAIFSMISASNASILAASRVALSMSRRGHLPEEIGAVSERTRTPVVALLLVGAAIGMFAVLLPLEDLAHFADVVLLTSMILVNAALIAHRRKYPDIERPFRVPFGPFLAVLGTVACLYLLFQIPHLAPVLLAIAALAIGFMGYLAWKGTRVAEEALPGDRSRVALERSALRDGESRVLVPVANPANVEQLVDLAAAVAADRKAELVTLRVTAVPDQLPVRREEAFVERERRVLETARARALEHGVPASSVVRIGHNVARAVLEAATERRCDLIVLGWKGYSSTTRRILGEVTDDVVRHAKTDLVLVKLVGEALPKKLILPSAGGLHAQRAAEYATSIVRSAGGSLTLSSVVAPGAQEERVEAEQRRLEEARARIVETTGFEGVDTKLIRHKSVSVGIIKEAERYDGIVVGAAGQSFSTQVLFGSIPEEVARHSNRTVIVVKRHHAVKALIGKVMSE